MRSLRKVISLFLCLILTLGLAVLPGGAAGKVEATLKGSDVPVILLGGDGDVIYDADGNVAVDMNDFGTVFRTSGGGDGIMSAVAGVLQPFLLEGVLRGKWDNYYANLQKEVSDLTETLRLDENGNPRNGTDISAAHRAAVERNKSTDKKGDKGYYGLQDYRFWYDWRLNPMEIADELHEYIEGVKAATGKERVSVICRCVGVNVVLAYIAKYGPDSLCGLGIDGSTSFGGEFISEALTGRFKLDADAISRFLTDYNELGMIDISEFALASVDLLAKSGLVKGLTAAVRATIYDKVVEGVTSALALGTFFTLPCYWSFVAPEDYDTAIRFVFGEEGSEKRQTYAGLIEKLDSYHEAVGLHVAELIDGVVDAGANLAIISKYGFQIFPVCSTNDRPSDQYSTVNHSSFGATTSTAFDTLPDDYVAARQAQGKGEFISPDRTIDASTCRYPDNTWFLKGARHGNWTEGENRILYTVTTADRPVTVNDLSLPRFLVYDAETDTVGRMTEENCGTEYWETTRPKGFAKLVSFFKAYARWLKALFAFLKGAIFKRG